VMKRPKKDGRCRIALRLEQAIVHNEMSAQSQTSWPGWNTAAQCHQGPSGAGQQVQRAAQGRGTCMSWPPQACITGK